MFPKIETLYRVSFQQDHASLTLHVALLHIVTPSGRITAKYVGAFPFPSPPLPLPSLFLPLRSPSPPLLSPLPPFAARGSGGALKLPQQVRAERGRQTFSGAFRAINPASDVHITVTRFPILRC